MANRMTTDGGLGARGPEILDLVGTVLCALGGLLLGRWLLPGVNFTYWGLVIAVALLVVPVEILTRVERRSSSSGVRVLCIVSMLIFAFAALALADWSTPDFNISSTEDYWILWSLPFGFAALPVLLVVAHRQSRKHAT